MGYDTPEKERVGGWRYVIPAPMMLHIATVGYGNTFIVWLCVSLGCIGPIIACSVVHGTDET